jgi:hypothetical protein
VTNKPLSQLRKNEKEQLLTALTAWQLPIQVLSYAGWQAGRQQELRHFVAGR